MVGKMRMETTSGLSLTQLKLEDDMAWLSVRRSASYAGISVRTLYAWHHMGLPKHKVIGRVMFSTDDIDAFIRNHQETSLDEKLEDFLK